MPRNPDKTRCSVPGCHAWAMREHHRCRSHRDAELAPRGAGAPLGNLNALQHGRYSHPLPLPELARLAEIAAHQPDDLPLHIALAVRSIHTRTGNVFLTLFALRRLLSQLTPLLATTLFAAELDDLLQPLPPQPRSRAQALIERLTSGLHPERRLLALRQIKKRHRNNCRDRDRGSDPDEDRAP